MTVRPNLRELPPQLVMAHGWLLRGRIWQPLQQQLEPQWSCWAPDLPGFGAAKRPLTLNPTLPAYGRWLAAEAVARAAGRPVVLLGHSLGGSVVLHAASLLGDQLRGVVLIGCGGGVYQRRPFARLRQVGCALSWVQPDRRAARGLLLNSTQRRAVAGLPGLVSRLNVPSLWIGGEKDQVMQPLYVRHLAGYAPSHQIEVIAGAGHLPMRDQPDDLAKVLLPWLQRVASPRS
jgi:2-succinyl-6-hydroxy-2,4-cyclohexadiene-1-carboxylate synthase